MIRPNDDDNVGSGRSRTVNFSITSWAREPLDTRDILPTYLDYSASISLLSDVSTIYLQF